MKIIGQKDRPSDLTNAIDLLSILTVLFAIVSGAERYRHKMLVAEGTKEGTVTFMITNVRQLSIDQMVLGDQIYHYDKGGLVGSIERVKPESYTDRLDYQGQRIEAPTPGKYQAHLKVKVGYTEFQGAYTVGGEAMRVGSEYRLKARRDAFYGTCIDMPALHKGD